MLKKFTCRHGSSAKRISKGGPEEEQATSNFLLLDQLLEALTAQAHANQFKLKLVNKYLLKLLPEGCFTPLFAA